MSNIPVAHLDLCGDQDERQLVQQLMTNWRSDRSQTRLNAPERGEVYRSLRYTPSHCRQYIVRIDNWRRTGQDLIIAHYIVTEANLLYAHRALAQTMAKQIPVYRFCLVAEYIAVDALLETYKTQHLVVAYDFTRREGRVTGEGLQCELIGLHPHTGDGHGKWVLRFPFLSGG